MPTKQAFTNDNFSIFAKACFMGICESMFSVLANANLQMSTKQTFANGLKFLFASILFSFGRTISRSEPAGKPGPQPNIGKKATI